MRRVIFGGATSLDNLFARKDDSVDWLMWNDEVGEIMSEFWTTIDHTPIHPCTLPRLTGLPVLLENWHIY